VQQVVQTKKGADTIVVVDQEKQALVEVLQAAVLVRLLVT
jgi:hypothetical protein